MGFNNQREVKLCICGVRGTDAEKYHQAVITAICSAEICLMGRIPGTYTRQRVSIFQSVSFALVSIKVSTRSRREAISMPASLQTFFI
jgi:hypothetical protein